jgi:hypothetical protein
MGHFYDQLREDGYKASLDLAWDDLLAIRSDGEFILPLLDGQVTVQLESRNVIIDLPGSDRFLEIVVLHYLRWSLQNEDKRGQWEWALFRQMPGGEAYQSAFQERTVRPLADVFSNDPTMMVKAAKGLGGRLEPLGSVTAVLPFLPHLEVRVTVWQGDDEVPGNATVLFPRTIPPMLPTEDYAEIGAVVLASLRRTSSSVQ